MFESYPVDVQGFNWCSFPTERRLNVDLLVVRWQDCTWRARPSSYCNSSVHTALFRGVLYVGNNGITSNGFGCRGHLHVMS